MTFNKAKRYLIKDDGTIIVRAGTQTNCGGIAQIHVKITKRKDPNIAFLPENLSLSSEGEYGLSVPGSKIPVQFLNAIHKGVKKAYKELDFNEGICIEILEALVHPTDATEVKFMEVGEQAIIGWIENQHT